MNKKMDCVKRMVNEFNMVSESLLERAFKDNIDDWTELTKYAEGDRVCFDGGYAEVKKIDIRNNVVYILPEDEDEELELDINEPYQEFDSCFPMWGTLFNPNDSFVSDWIEEHLFETSNCGFRIFQDEQTGEIYLGVEGAGYDFYEAHWVKLYDAMGLQWHDSEEDIKKQEEFNKRCVFVNNEMRVFTDDGYIVVRPNIDTDYPGVSIDLHSQNIDNSIENGANINEVSLVLIEKDNEDNSYVTRVWGNDLQEDYTDKITHKIHLKK